ncbi:putative Methyltransferase-related protein [Quillaja saponaria]|uniref:Methyltransferase-related protein n=1 Tax=Quillaja saponaria TaxID=32244 RepID=A0AAD7LMV7_QUISA|nr:putative Methyltransferase-related protein [Quillaja saponaria]
MCPLRLILIFLSATLAGFFVLRNLNSEPQAKDDADNVSMNPSTLDSSNFSHTRFSKVKSAIESGFWVCVDMASGRYLWKHLVSSSSKGSD